MVSRIANVALNIVSHSSTTLVGHQVLGTARFVSIVSNSARFACGMCVAAYRDNEWDREGHHEGRSCYEWLIRYEHGQWDRQVGRRAYSALHHPEQSTGESRAEISCRIDHLRPQ